MLAPFVGGYSSINSRDEEQGDCPSDTKRKGPKTREYPKPLFDLVESSCAIFQVKTVDFIPGQVEFEFME